MSDLKIFIIFAKKFKTMEDVTKKVIQAFEESNEPLKTGQIAEKTGIDSKEITKIIK